MEKVELFYKLATEYVSFLRNNEISYESIDYLISILMKLYITALELPNIEPDSEDIDYESNKLRINIRIHPKLETMYWQIFDPFNDEDRNNPCCGSLYDDFQSIAEDIHDGINEYVIGRVGNAVFEWHFGVISHWGDHTVNAIRALHALRMH